MRVRYYIESDIPKLITLVNSVIGCKSIESYTVHVPSKKIKCIYTYILSDFV